MSPLWSPHYEARILLVDDDHACLSLLSKLLAREGYRNILAVDRATGVPQQLRDFPTDLVILDLRLPGMTGLELLEQITGDPDTPAILVMTADTAYGVRQQAYDMGAWDFIRKPIEAEELLPRVRILLAIRQLWQDLKQLRGGQ